MKKIPYGHQWVDEQDIKAVVKVLRSDWLTQGPTVQRFEEALCQYTGAKYAAVVSNGTAALHLTMMALGMGKGDELVTSPITFSASANGAFYVGARPRFVDIDDKTYHMDIDKLREFLKSPSRRKKIKVIVLVHFMGTLEEVYEVKRICDQYGIKLVEDAAHALGAKYQWQGTWFNVGQCRHSDATILSFHPIKQMTTGEGGAVLTNDKKIYEKVSRLRHHGIVKDQNKPLWFYDIPEIGFNYRLSDLQCALGISQLKKLNTMVRQRRKLVQSYNQWFAGLEQIARPCEATDTYASYHLYVIRVLNQRRNRLYDYLRAAHILTQVNYIPVHLFSYYQKALGYREGDFPVAEKYAKECLSLPLYYGLTDRQQNYVINRVKGFFKNEK